jgi:phosphinothricin acetyltransferase
VPTVLIRDADPNRDAAACAAIYAPYVTDSAVSLELVAPSAEEFATRMRTIVGTHPFLVAVTDAGDDAGAIAGFAYAAPHHERAGYRWCADVTVYIDPLHHRRGVGRQLYEALLELLRRQGLWTACAGIGLPNDASLGLHQACGFELVGIYRRVAHKHGAWQDVAWLQLDLRPDQDFAARLDPPEPSPPEHLN